MEANEPSPNSGKPEHSPSPPPPPPEGPPQTTFRWSKALQRRQWLLLLLVLTTGIFAGSNAGKGGRGSRNEMFRAHSSWAPTSLEVQLRWTGASVKTLRRRLWKPLYPKLEKHPLSLKVRSSFSPGLLSLAVSSSNKSLSATTLRRQLAPLLRSLPAGVRVEWPPLRARQLPLWTYRLRLGTRAATRKKGAATSGRRTPTPFPLAKLSLLQERFVAPWLRSLPGVEQVVSQGLLHRRFAIRLRQERPLRHLSDKALLLTIRAITRTWEPTQGNPRSALYAHRLLAALEQRVVFRSGSRIVRLHEVAKVTTRILPGNNPWMFNGDSIVGGKVWLAPGANAASTLAFIRARWPAMERKWRKKLGPATLTVKFQTLHSSWRRFDQLRQTLWPLAQTLFGLLALLLLVFVRRWRLSLVLLSSSAWNALLTWSLLRTSTPLTPDVLVTFLWSQVLVVGLLWQVGVRANALLRATAGRSESEYLAELKPVLRACAAAASLLSLCWLGVWWLPYMTSLQLRPLLRTALLSLAMGTLTACLVLPAMLRSLLHPPRLGGLPWKRLLPLLNLTSVLLMLVVGFLLFWYYLWWLGLLVLAFALYLWTRHRLPEWARIYSNALLMSTSAAGIGVWTVSRWWPLGSTHGFLKNLTFVAVAVLALFLLNEVVHALVRLSSHLFLRTKRLYVLVSLLWLGLGVFLAQGADAVWQWLPRQLSPFSSANVQRPPLPPSLRRWFPGLQRSGSPTRAEGWWLWRPQLPAGSSSAQTLRALRQCSLALGELPEVSRVLAHGGRNATGGIRGPGHQLTFWIRLAPHRQWRGRVRSPAALRSLLAKASRLPGVSEAPFEPLWQSTLSREVGGSSARLGLRITANSAARWWEGWRRLRAELAGLTWLHTKSARVQVPQALSRGRSPWAPVRLLAWSNKAGDSMVAVQGFPNQVTTSASKPSTRPVRSPSAALLAERLQGRRWEGRIWFSAQRYAGGPPIAARLQRWLRQSMARGGTLAGLPLQIKVVGTHSEGSRAERALLLITPLLCLLLLALLWIWNRSLALAIFVFGQGFLSLIGGLVALWLLSLPLQTQGEVLGVSLPELFSLRPVALSAWVWFGFAGVVGHSLLEGLLWSAAWRQWWKEQEPSSPRQVRQGLLRLSKGMMNWSLRLRILLVALSLPLLTWKGPGLSTLRPLLWPLLGGWLFSLATLWWMPALLGWRAERRLARRRKQKQASTA